MTSVSMWANLLLWDEVEQKGGKFDGSHQLWLDTLATTHCYQKLLDQEPVKEKATIQLTFSGTTPRGTEDEVKQQVRITSRNDLAIVSFNFEICAVCSIFVACTDCVGAAAADAHKVVVDEAAVDRRSVERAGQIDSSDGCSSCGCRSRSLKRDNDIDRRSRRTTAVGDATRKQSKTKKLGVCGRSIFVARQCRSQRVDLLASGARGADRRRQQGVLLPNPDRRLRYSTCNARTKSCHDIGTAQVSEGFDAKVGTNTYTISSASATLGSKVWPSVTSFLVCICGVFLNKKVLQLNRFAVVAGIIKS
jgi:hypothetical protein